MLLEARQLTYRNKTKTLIETISAEFSSGSIYGILGPNGSGKTTLLKTLAGLWKPSCGSVLWNNQDLFDLSRKDISKIISLVPQSPAAHFDFTVSEVVAMGCYMHSKSILDEKLAAENALTITDAWHLRDRLLSQLSGGERQRVYIARTIATQAPILLLDEPTSHLDLRHQLEVWHLLKQLVGQGKVIIVALHDLWAAQRFCDQLLILNQGQCIAKGDASIITPEILREVFGVVLKDPFTLGLCTPWGHA